MDRKKFIKAYLNGDISQEILETLIYHIYWVWSMVAYITYGNLDKAHRIMHQSAFKVTGHERMARKVVLKVFSDIALAPEKHLEDFISSAYRYEISRQETPDFSLTRKLVTMLRRAGLMSPERISVWETKLSRI
ncbi:MAG: hypothetical protein H0Z39_00250 [Peptococcaceae bacterium]|nr:hypothetical protein [Peptococcaceae bacterium]